MALPAILRKEVGSPTSGVEVGVAFGSMSIWLTRMLPTLRMICVDSFEPYDETDGMSKVMESSAEELVRLVRWRFANEGHNRLTLWEKKSLDAAHDVPFASQDFVFIDASHQYESVIADIKAWSPKVRPGGIVCGHDYCELWPSVIRAVHESFQGREVFVHSDSTIWCVRAT